jgi:hypothetical protein
MTNKKQTVNVKYESSKFRSLLNQTSARLNVDDNPYTVGNMLIMGFRRDLMYSQKGISLCNDAQILALEAAKKTNNSSTLAKNIEAHSDKKKQPGTHSHHIVAQRAKAAAPARAVMFAAGIGVNDYRNGVNVSGEYHSGMHTLPYYGKINGILGLAEDDGDEAVSDALLGIGRKILTGTFI